MFVARHGDRGQKFHGEETIYYNPRTVRWREIWIRRNREEREGRFNLIFFFSCLVSFLSGHEYLEGEWGLSFLFPQAFPKLSNQVSLVHLCILRIMITLQVVGPVERTLHTAWSRVELNASKILWLRCSIASADVTSVR